MQCFTEPSIVQIITDIFKGYGNGSFHENGDSSVAPKMF